MKKIRVLPVLVLFTSFLHAQSRVETVVQLMTPDVIAEATIDREPYFAWVKKLKDEVEMSLQKVSGNHDVMVMITSHNDKDATIMISARPKLPGEMLEGLKAKLSQEPSVRIKYSDFSFALITKINEGCGKEIDFTPAIPLPDERDIVDFKKLNLADKKAALQEWVQNDIIPTLAHYETAVDPKFTGVLGVGNLLKEKKYIPTDVAALTEKNPDYWRATMEMSVGNQLIPFTKACLHIIGGEFDKAKQLMFVIRFFSDEATLPSAYRKALVTKLDLINQELSDAINKGIALHDKGNYKEAVAHYETLLESFPHSAWLNYECFYSKTEGMKNQEESLKEWAKWKPVIYACDPMYHMNVQATSGKEGYLLFRRQEVNSLFQSKESLKKDIVQYADIALDLENYGFAAQMYWLMATYFSEEEYGKRNILAYYLYCLDKLGDKEAIKNFEGNFPKEFVKIADERRKIMEASSIYKAFEKGE